MEYTLIINFQIRRFQLPYSACDVSRVNVPMAGPHVGRVNVAITGQPVPHVTLWCFQDGPGREPQHQLRRVA